MRAHGGKLEAVLFGKILNEQQRRCMVWDIERGQSNVIEPQPWQTDTCLGDWLVSRKMRKRLKFSATKTCSFFQTACILPNSARSCWCCSMFPESGVLATNAVWKSLSSVFSPRI